MAAMTQSQYNTAKQYLHTSGTWSPTDAQIQSFFDQNPSLVQALEPSYGAMAPAVETGTNIQSAVSQLPTSGAMYDALNQRLSEMGFQGGIAANPASAVNVWNTMTGNSQQNTTNVNTSNAAYQAQADARHSGGAFGGLGGFGSMLNDISPMNNPFTAATLAAFSLGSSGLLSGTGGTTDGLTGVAAGNQPAAGITGTQALQGASGGGDIIQGLGANGLSTGSNGIYDFSGLGSAGTSAATSGAPAAASGLGGFLGLTPGTGIAGSGITLPGLAGTAALGLGAVSAMNGPSAPPPFNPATAAAAQTASNQQTALYQQQLNNVNQNTPYGTLNYTSTPGVNGAAPTTTATTTLSPAQQSILNNQEGLQQQQQAISKTALNQAGVNQATPFNLGGLTHQLASASDISNAESAGTQDVIRLMQPQMTQNDELFTAQLANQGITQGSQAYNSAMLQHSNANNAAYTQAALTGVQAGQALQQEALTNNQQDVSNYTQQYNAPINQYQALQNGVQVNNPSFSAPQNNNVMPTNSLQAAQQAYQAQLNAYNANTSSNNSTASGLFGLGGSFLNGLGNTNSTKLFGMGSG